jgi:hypothetical protein
MPMQTEDRVQLFARKLKAMIRGCRGRAGPGMPPDSEAKAQRDLTIIRWVLCEIEDPPGLTDYDVMLAELAAAHEDGGRNSVAGGSGGG